MNEEGKGSFKKEAQEAFSRGNWRKALEKFRCHCADEPGDLRSQLKMAECLERLGLRKEAGQAYRKIAEAYAQDGFLLQAISLHKMILRIDPSATDVHARLAQLYTEKAREAKPFRFFPHIPLFSELNEDELRLLLQKVLLRTYAIGDFICREGEAGDSLFIISQGEVGILRQRTDEKEIPLRHLREGECFGEFGFFTDKKRHATVKALGACEILEISREDLNQIITSHPGVRDTLQRLFQERVLDLFLASSPFFSSLGHEERGTVLKKFHLLQVPAETLLFKGGDPPQSLYLVKSGEVEVFTQNRQGRKVALGKLGSGHFIGEIGALFNKPRMAFAKTTLPSELLELSREDLEIFLQQFPGLRSSLREISLKRLARIKEIFSQEAIEKTREAMV